MNTRRRTNRSAARPPSSNKPAKVERVGAHHPLQPLRRESEFVLDRGQRAGDDRGVENDHEERAPQRSARAHQRRGSGPVRARFGSCRLLKAHPVDEGSGAPWPAQSIRRGAKRIRAAASVLQASGFRTDVTVFRLNAASTRKIPAWNLHLGGIRRNGCTWSRRLITRRSQVQILPPLLERPRKRGLPLSSSGASNDRGARGGLATGLSCRTMQEWRWMAGTSSAVSRSRAGDVRTRERRHRPERKLRTPLRSTGVSA